MKPSTENQSDVLAQFKRVCQKAGVKYTGQRAVIFSEIVSNPNHPDAETVYRQVRPKLAGISLDTVYRTLWLLKDLGLIRTLGPPRERTRFDANLKPHSHFICRQCNDILDFESKTFRALSIPQAAKKMGRPEEFQVTIQGTCKTCLKKEEHHSDGPIKEE